MKKNEFNEVEARRKPYTNRYLDAKKLCCPHVAPIPAPIKDKKPTHVQVIQHKKHLDKFRVVLITGEEAAAKASAAG
jgi:hypothetical protein